mgnify:CR=1 FL=1
MLFRSDNKNLPPIIAFDRQEQKIIKAYFKKKETPKTLRDYIILVARLGGYLARKSDSPPGITVIWRGLNKLFNLRMGFELVGN